MGTTRWVAIIALVVFAAACSDTAGDPGQLGGSTGVATTVTATPSPASVVSDGIPGSVTTTPPPTTSNPPTPTTSTSTTTTVGATPTWADEPLVIAGSGLGALGWWDGDRWVRVETDMVLPVRGGEDYRIVLLGNEGLVTGGSQEVRCDFSLPMPGVVLVDGGGSRLIDEAAGLSGLAISAPWDPTPRPVEEIQDDGTYAAFAAAILEGRGLNVDEPVIRQLIRFDLEGDGRDEVLVVAGDTVDDGQITFGEAHPGDYSVVFLRRLTDNGVATWVLAESVATGSEPVFWEQFSVSGVADLSGDSKMEIVLSGVAWESYWVTVFEYIDDVTGPQAVMGSGCGV